MADEYTALEKPGSRKSPTAPWRRLITGSTDTTGFSPLQMSATPPGAGSVPCMRFPSARFMFAGTDAADETVNFRIVGWALYNRAGTKFWVRSILAQGMYILGAVTAGTAGADIEGSGTLMADEITFDAKYPGAWVSPAVDGNTPVLTVDLQNSLAVEVDTDLGTAATATVLVKLGDDLASGDTAEDPALDVDFQVEGQSVSHTHTNVSDAESIEGVGAFSPNAVIQAVGIDTPIAIGTSKGLAEAGAIKSPAGVPIRFKLTAGAILFWLHANTGGEVSIYQVRV